MTLVVIAASVDVAVAADGAAAFVDQRKNLTLDVSAAAAAANYVGDMKAGLGVEDLGCSFVGLADKLVDPVDSLLGHLPHIVVENCDPHEHEDRGAAAIVAPPLAPPDSPSEPGSVVNTDIVGFLEMRATEACIGVVVVVVVAVAVVAVAAVGWDGGYIRCYLRNVDASPSAPLHPMLEFLPDSFAHLYLSAAPAPFRMN